MTDTATSSDAIKELVPSPLQLLHSPLLENAGITLYIKRDDLLHPQFGGNKWRKLKYNLVHARNNNYHTLLTFGGAWSNHIYATAAAGKAYGFKTIGIIRGEEHKPLNATLAFAKDCGMRLHYVDRAQYRLKNEAHYLNTLKHQFGQVYILPEGGSNALALKGCKEIIDEITLPFDVICCASGTGATLAGLISALRPDQSAIGFSALKGGDFLADEVNAFLQNKPTDADWRIEDRFHFGGYAKINDALIHFMKNFQADYGITLDAVYTGKMFYGLFELIKTGAFDRGSTIIAVHSGGLQGNKGFNL